MKGHCMKCGVEKEMLTPEESMTKNGRRMAKGKCETCGTVVCKFLKNEA